MVSTEYFMLVFTIILNKDMPALNLFTAYQSSKKNFATICVDWAPLAFHNDPGVFVKYVEAVENTIVVGTEVAEFIKYLQKQKVIKSLGSVHLIGFSLGAQVSGVAGNKLGGKLGRITGISI